MKKRSLKDLTTRERAQYLLNNGFDVKCVINPETMKLSYQALCGKFQVSDYYTDEHECLTDTLSILRRQAGEGYETIIERK